MSDESKPQSEWARRRAAAQARHAKRIKREETFFDLLVSGYSVEQIAQTTKLSRSTVRRAIDQALAKRRLAAPEHFARLQIARLNKALRCADVALEDGDLKAVAPFLKVVAELNQFYGLAAGPSRLAPPAPAAKVGRVATPPLALPHARPASESAIPEELGSREKEVVTD